MSKSRRRSQNGRRSVPSARRSQWLLPITLMAALLVVGGAVLLWQRNSQPSVPPQVTGAPRVAVSQEAIDYGDAKLNTSIETVFHVRNVGDQPLKILGEPQVELVQGC
jgi:hypothetical protein